MKAFIAHVWNSPTFTTWANLSTKSLRFLLVTPLILNRFDTTEIAAWYLFMSITFFGTIIHSRVSLTFNRMIAFAMAGARDLSTIVSTKKPRGDGEPHWPTVRRAYGTVGFLTLITAAVTLLSSLALAYYSLTSMMAGYEGASKVWISLFIVLGGQCFSMCFSQYSVTIQGMGLVALSNRWTCLFSLVSIAVGFVALTFGADIVILAAVMQGVMLLDVIRMKFLVGYVHEGELRQARSIAYDQEIIGWAWPAFWRGMFTTIMNRGVLQMGAVVYARYAAVDAVAAFLFSFNLLRTVASFAEAPIQSSGPMLSRKLAQGHTDSLKRQFFRTSTQAQLLFVVGAFAIGSIIPIALGYIDSNAQFLDPLPWAILSSAHIMQRYTFVGLRLPALGNKVIYLKQTTIAAIVSFVLFLPMIKHYGFYGLIIATYLPLLVSLNIGPFRSSSKMLEISTMSFLRKSCAWAIAGYFVLQAGLIYFL